MKSSGFSAPRPPFRKARRRSARIEAWRNCRPRSNGLTDFRTRRTQQIQRWGKCMPQAERLDVVVLGSGTGGKLLAWHMARSGQRTAAVERRWIGGACPNVACMPSKNEIRSAEVAHLARHAAEYGTMTNSVVVDMATVRRRKREMVERQVAKHLENYKASGAQIIMGCGRFVAPKALEVSAHGAGTPPTRSF